MKEGKLNGKSKTRSPEEVVEKGRWMRGVTEIAEGVQSEVCKLEQCLGCICCSFKNLTKKNSEN